MHTRISHANALLIRPDLAVFSSPTCLPAAWCPQVARAKNEEAAIRAETDTKVGEAKTLLTANLAKQKKEVNGMIICAAGKQGTRKCLH